MKIHLIWAQDENGGIGKDGKLPWHIPEDLKNFKQLTLNSIIIMGRVTWESLPLKPLPRRRNIVLSSNVISNIECYKSVEKCIDALENENIKSVFVIGGTSIYYHFYNRADELHITCVNKIVEGIDTFFPVNMKIIEKSFQKIGIKTLSKNATYSHWEKSLQ